MYNPGRRERQEERQDRQLRGCPMIKCLFTGLDRAGGKNLELLVMNYKPCCAPYIITLRYELYSMLN